MQDFVAIDFELANAVRTSVCSVGIVVVRGGEIVDRFYSLVHPEPNYYHFYCSKVNGLTRKDTDKAPSFPAVWKKIVPKVVGLPFVAHDKSFDESCLKACFRHHGMRYPGYEFYCTMLKSRQVWPEGQHKLNIIAERCGYKLTKHHHALSDAEACAWIAREIL